MQLHFKVKIVSLVRDFNWRCILGMLTIYFIFYPSLGVLVEGFGVLLNGFCGTGIGVTSYGDNISMIAITKVTKRIGEPNSPRVPSSQTHYSKCKAISKFNII